MKHRRIRAAECPSKWRQLESGCRKAEFPHGQCSADPLASPHVEQNIHHRPTRAASLPCLSHRGCGKVQHGRAAYGCPQGDFTLVINPAGLVIRAQRRTGNAEESMIVGVLRSSAGVSSILIWSVHKSRPTDSEIYHRYYEILCSGHKAKLQS